MYDDHLSLVGKRIGDLVVVLVLTELFLLGRTAEVLRAIIVSKSAISLQRGPADPKFQVEALGHPQPFFSHITRVNDLSHGIKIWTNFSFVLSQSTRLTDGQTDGRPDRQKSDR